MDINPLKMTSVAALTALVMVGCGGGGSDSGQIEPPCPIDPPGSIDWPSGPIGPSALKLELLTGKPSVDFGRCQSDDGAADEAQFSHLQRITVYKDAVYLAETGEDCANRVYYDDFNLIPSNLLPAIRKLSDGVVETQVTFTPGDVFGYDPVTVRYPSGVHRKESTGEYFVSGYAAAKSERNFALDECEVSRYTRGGGWYRYVPGLFRLRPSQSHADYGDLVAGAGSAHGVGSGKPPSHADGRGHAARFTAPHNLEADAAGLFYLIDDGRIRTIDGDYEVKTLDHEALGITGAVKALDADHQGNIHVLAQRSGPSYTWHRLTDGSQVDFHLRNTVWPIEPISLETFTVIGDDMLLAVRHIAISGYNNTSLYQISATGEVTELTGNATPTTPQDFLDQPSQYMLPPVKHIEYGVDGHLYIVLPQGVLVSRNYGAQ